MNALPVAVVMGLAVISGLTTFIGVGLALRFGKHRGGVAVGTGFSVGIMVLIAVFELIPDALQSAPATRVAAATFLGAVTLALLHWLIPHRHLIEEHGILGARMLRTAYLVALGLILHDLPEGFAMANAYVASPSLGIMLALAIAAHNIPEEFAMAVPAAALGRRKTVYAAALSSALAEPVGAALGLFGVYLYPALNATFMAFAAGAMIFVSLHELLPMARLYGGMRLFELGVLMSGGVYTLLAILIPN